MDRRFALLLSLILIVVIVASLFFYIASLPAVSSPDAQSILWQNPQVQGFAKDFAVADGKIFVTDNYAYVQCFDESTGESIWNTSLHYADYGGQPVVKVYGGKLYASTGNGVVDRLNMNTGEIEMEYQAPPRDINNYKMVPIFFLADGKLFITNEGTAVYDVATGQQLWFKTYNNYTISEESGSLLKSDFTYITSDSNAVYRTDPNNGNIMWTYSGSSSGMTLVTQEEVVLWNYVKNNTLPPFPQSKFIIVCLNIDTGQELWRFEIGTQVFQPTVKDGLLLFGALNGYFYGLNMTDGSVKWKTNVDSSGIIEKYRQDISNNPSGYYQPYFSPTPSIDSQNQRIFWCLFSGYSSHDNATNTGVFMCLDAKTGNILWYNQVNSSLIYSIYGQSMVLLNDELFVAGSNAVYCLKAFTGNILWERSFDHYVLNPILADDKVFIVADMYIIAYR
jgi:outer membrane protein assembly factor BamB